MRRWTAGGLAIGLGLVLLWTAGGVGVYLALGSHKGAVARRAVRPGESGTTVNPALARLPGTLYLVQDGALYRLQQGRFGAVLPAGGWTQPAQLPGGQGVVVVKRDGSGFSDLYRVTAAGQLQQLTHNQGRGAVQGVDPGGQLVTQYWAMYPRISADARQVFFVTDQYKHIRCCPFDVTMRVAQMPLNGGTPKFWTVDGITPADTHTQDGGYAGGDVQPVPLASGGVLFVRYAYAGDTVGSQLMLIRQPKATPVPLTAPEDHCGQPALSASGNRVAMVCSYGGQNTSVEVAALDGAAMGPRQVLVSGVQAAQPTWSPDGGQVVYLAPAGLAGHFQLWSATAPAALPTPVPAAPGRSRTPGPSAQAPQPAAPGPASATPVQLTDNLDFDATSTIAWAG